MSWILLLPADLATRVQTLVAAQPDALGVVTDLYAHLVPDGKRKKPLPGATPVPLKQEPQPVQTQDSCVITVATPIAAETIIFELPQASFQSPLRKKLNLTFHLIEHNNEPIPVLSIVNPARETAELSLVHLHDAIKLCTVIPILGNSTNTQKKAIVSLCFWLNQDHVGDAHARDPIICQVNLDTVKKNMIKLGKLPADIETQFAEQLSNKSELAMNPIQERIIDYLQRQFKLCGVNLVNYLACHTLFSSRYALNADSAVALSNGVTNTFIMVEAYKGSKDGSLLFLAANSHNPPFIIFGFKKPILLFEIKDIKHTSYSNITRLTFSLLLTAGDTTIEFSMIDQKYFPVIDEFIKAENINDNSFDENLREKRDVKEEGTEEGGNAEVAGAVDDEDEEEDGDYAGGEEEEEGDGSGSGSGSDDDEFESDADSRSDGEGDESDGEGNDNDEAAAEEEDDGVFHKNQEEEDLD